MRELNKIKITYIISDIDRAVAFEWIADQLDNRRFELSFILMNKQDSYLEKYLIEKNITLVKIHYRGKKDILKAILKIFFFLRKNKTEVVHGHLFEASLCGMMAARLAGVKKRIYTRHYSNQHHTYFPSAVKYDLLINKLSTHIVAISKNVQDILIRVEKVNPAKVYLIHHGFKLELFERSEISPSRISTLKNKYHLSNQHPVVGVISRFIHLKGLQYIIPAFAKLLSTFPNAVLVLANATGNYQNEIEKLISGIPPVNYRKIKFENDIFALYQLFDVFVHVPVDRESEAFGQTYVEALAAGIPSVFTLSGVAPEFIVHQKNAWVVPHQNSDAIHDAIKSILNDAGKNKLMLEQGKKDANEFFSIHRMIHLLTVLYEN